MKKGISVNINPGSDIAKEADCQSNLLHRILDAITEVRGMSIDIKSDAKIEKEIIHQTKVLERIAKELESLSSAVNKMKNSPIGKYSIKIDEKTKKGIQKAKKRKRNNLTIIFKFNAENILPRLDEFIEERVMNIQKKYPHAHVRIEVLH